MVTVSSIFKKLFTSDPKRKIPRTDISKRFDLVAQRGPGSMSKVWKAHDRNIGRTVCLKILDKAKTIRFEARFPGLVKPTEGAILMSLHHRNVVKTFDHGLTKEGEQFLVMEWIEGLGFNYLIENKSPQLKGKRIEYLMAMADGLEYVHRQGYLHRDICPRNTMLDQEGVLKLIDFGLSIPDTQAFHKPGNRTGTPNYLAPELIKRTRTDHRVDLFALGVTAYEMLTTKLPWEKTESLQTLLHHLNTPGKDPREHRPDLDEAMAKFLIKAVERNPDRRFQTAAEFRNALRALPNQDY
jgi:eukaryotic-like serine/threonine-protein kinase